MGGNAKTHQWPDGPVTGLSVLAWPKLYFRNYGALLQSLGVATTPVDLRFYLRRSDGESFAHGRDEALSARYGVDFARWARLVGFVRKCNAFFCGSAVPSLYHFSLLNPMNMVPLRWLCAAFGISTGFWRDVITPLHCTTFLTTSLELVPAVVVPTIDDLVPLEATPRLETWVGSSRAVFDGIRKAAGHKLCVHGGCDVVRVQEAADGSKTVVVRRACSDGSPKAAGCAEGTTLEVYTGYDRVVFATNAQHAASALPRDAWAWRAARWLLSMVRYSDEECPLFRKGVIHSDATVLPADVRELVCRGYCNYIAAYAPGGASVAPTRLFENMFVLSSWYPTVVFENTFVLSSWYPTVVSRAEAYPAVPAKCEGDGRPRFVSYGLRQPGRVSGPVGEVRNETNHPAISPAFLLISMIISFFNGQHGVFFCGSFATPGNGHDLSLCSGLAVAAAIGAKYPFDDPAAEDDLTRLRRILGV